MHEALGAELGHGVSIGRSTAGVDRGQPSRFGFSRLQQFWSASHGLPARGAAPFDLVRMDFNRWSASSSMAFGVPRFFPRGAAPAVQPTERRAAVDHDTAPLRDTLRTLSTST